MTMTSRYVSCMLRGIKLSLSSIQMMKYPHSLLNTKNYQLSLQSFSSSMTSKGERLFDIDAINKEYKQEIDEITSKFEEKKKRRQQIVGVVTSAKTSKTINVTYYHNKYNRKYNCYISVRRKVMAHDEAELCDEGDLVRVVPCAPKSSMKRHVLIDLLKKAKKLEDTSPIPADGTVASAVGGVEAPLIKNAAASSTIKQSKVAGGNK